jgi:uncharacterized damage-inducible protein DinB
MTKFRLEDVWDHLARTPKVLRAMLEGLPDEWLHCKEGENTWSPIEVLEHLIHGEKTDWVCRAQMIIQYGDSQEFPPFDRFAHLDQKKDKSLKMLLDQFETLRLMNIKTVQSLIQSNQDLDRVGKHPDFGKVTLQQLLSTWVVHDLNHIRQIVRVMAKYYQDEVGPWKAYLTILH